MLESFLHIVNDFPTSENEFRISKNEFRISKNEFQISINDFRILEFSWISGIRKWISDIGKWTLDIRIFFLDIWKYISDNRKSPEFWIPENSDFFAWNACVKICNFGDRDSAWTSLTSTKLTLVGGGSYTLTHECHLTSKIYITTYCGRCIYLALCFEIEFEFRKH